MKDLATQEEKKKISGLSFVIDRIIQFMHMPIYNMRAYKLFFIRTRKILLRLKMFFL